MRGNWGQQIVSLSPATTTREGRQLPAARTRPRADGLTGRGSMTSAYVNWRVSGQERAKIANFATAKSSVARLSTIGQKSPSSSETPFEVLSLLRSSSPVLCHSYFFLPVRGSARRSVGLHPPSLPPSLPSLQSHSADDDRSIDLGGVGGKDDRAARGRAEGTGGRCGTNSRQNIDRIWPRQQRRKKKRSGIPVFTRKERGRARSARSQSQQHSE